MHSTTIFASVLAFAASALAQVDGYAAMTSPTQDQDLAAGSTFEIEWLTKDKYTNGATVSLLGGKTPSTLEVMREIGSVDISSGSFAWTIDSSLGGKETYGIKITDNSDPSLFQYSFPFHISGGEAVSSSSEGYPTATVEPSSSGAPASTECESSTIATSYPVATLSTAISSSTECESSTIATTYPITTVPQPAYPTMSAPTGNLSTTAYSYPSGQPTTMTSGTSAAASTPATASTSATAIPTAGAAKTAAGSLALMGGLAAAIFAL